MARKRTLVTIPEKALNDQSLKLVDLRVLGQLALFCDRTTGISQLERGVIADNLGIRKEHVTRSTTWLEKCGWVEKIGKGCRSNPTQYCLLWLIKDDEDNTLKGATHGTQLDQERVPHMAPNQPLKGAAHGTQSPLKGATHGTQSPLKGATHGTQSPLKGATHGTQYAYQRVHAHAYSFLLNIYNNTDPDPDQTRRAEAVDSAFGLTDALNILIAHGTPEPYLRKDEDRQLVASWLKAGVDAAWLTTVCQEAKKRKRDGKPVGPRYIDRVMTSMTGEVKRAAGQQFSSTNYRNTKW